MASKDNSTARTDAEKTIRDAAVDALQNGQDADKPSIPSSAVDAVMKDLGKADGTSDGSHGKDTKEEKDVNQTRS